MAGWRRGGGGETKEKEKNISSLSAGAKKNTEPLAPCRLSQVTPSSTVDVAETQMSVRLNSNDIASD